MAPSIFLAAELLACGGSTAPATPSDDQTTTQDPNLDRDEDGHTADTDCNDSDPGIHPGAPEHCSGLDEDCDGEIDEGMFATFYVDDDGDGFGDDDRVLEACEQPPRSSTMGGDCNDDDPAIHPDAIEVCNVHRIDEDCDGLVDADDPDMTGDMSTWYVDADDDGWGNTHETVTDCIQPGGTTVLAGDCDDSDGSRSPGHDERCTGQDDDCDGLVDMDDDSIVDVPPWFFDEDGDGYGAPPTEIVTCIAPAGMIDTGGDCEDSIDTIHPGATEVCDDDLDNDCDTVADLCVPAGDIDWAAYDKSVVGHTPEAVGYAFASGDYNGDGSTDIVAGAPNSSLTDLWAGTSYVVAGPLGNLSTGRATASWSEGVWGAGSGTSVALSDLDNDGYDDLVSAQAEGWPVVVYGPRQGSALAEDEAMSRGDLSGTAASFLVSQDYTADGIVDLVVGAPYATDSLGNNAGAVYLVDGTTTWGDIDATAAAWLEGTEKYGRLGLSVDHAGDTDGDGIAEVIAGAPYLTTSASYEGAAYVWSTDGWTGSLKASAATAILTGTYTEEKAGTGVAGLGDIDLDGYDDLAVGAPGVDAGVTDGGAVYIVHGPVSGKVELETASSVKLLGWADEMRVGEVLAGRGDVTGDARGALLVGVPHSDEGASGSGAAYLFMGPLSGTADLDDAAHASFVPDEASIYAGTSVGFVRDISGDGYDEVAFGATGGDGLIAIFDSETF